VSAPTPLSLDSFNCRKTLAVDGKTYVFYSLSDAEKNGLAGISKLPYSMKVLLETCCASRMADRSPSRTSRRSPSGSTTGAAPARRSASSRRAC